VTVPYGYLPTVAGKMERSRSRRCTGMRYALLDPILGELAWEGRIGISGQVIVIL